MPRPVGRSPWTLPRRAVLAVLLLALAFPAASGGASPSREPGPVAVAAGPTVGGTPVFPDDNIWNRPVSDLPVHPNSAAYLANIGLGASLKADFGAGLWDGGPIGIPFVVVGGGQPKVAIHYTAYGDESDPGPFPIPANAPVEGGAQSDGDRHVLVIDKDNGVLYELYRAFPNPDGSWNADSGARYNLNSHALRPDTWTSADAAGLPIFPGLARYDEVAAGAITHALRFTVPRTRKAHVWPARHDASSSTDPTRPPMGQRFRLKASVDISGYPYQARVILQALKDYGMILADNGSALYVSGAPDERWNNSDLATLRSIKASDFEAVDSDGLMIDPNSGQARGMTPNPGPAGALTWYFAEGYTGPGFDQYLTIQNPNATAAQVTITYYLTGAPPITKHLSVPAHSRDTVVVHDTSRGAGRDQAVSAKVASTNGVGIIVERPIYFTYTGPTIAGITDGHTVLGATAPAPRWYFAEGYTGPGFEEYLTILNPSANPAPVTITYYLASGGPVTRHLTVPATERATVAVHDAGLGVGRDQAVAARVETTNPDGIVVERPMYFRYGATVTGGHLAMGTPAPQAAWYFAEGYTGAGFDTYLTILNPNASPAAVTITYAVVGGAPVTRGLTVGATARATVAVHDTGLGVGRDKTVSIKVTTTHPGGIVVERPIYFTYGSGINGGHTAVGAAAPRPAWYFAEGYTGAGFDEYLIVHNPNTTPALVTITYYPTGGTPRTVALTVPLQSRATVSVHDPAQGVGRGQPVAARVTTNHPGGVVAERAMYFLYGGGIDGGHTAVGFAP